MSSKINSLEINLGDVLGASDVSPFLSGAGTQFSPKAILDRLGDKVVSTGLTNVVYGRDFFDGFDQLGRTFLVTETMGVVQFGIGEIGDGMNHQWEGSLPHMILHGGLGCVAMEVMDGNCASGFFAGASQSVLAGSGLSDQQKLELASLVGSAAAFLFADGQAVNVNFGGAIALSGLENNYLTHAQWNDLNAELEQCHQQTKACDPQVILAKYRALSAAQNVAFTACISRGDAVCVDTVLADLRELRTYEGDVTEAYLRNLEANGVSFQASGLASDIVWLDDLAIAYGHTISFDLAHLDETLLG